MKSPMIQNASYIEDKEGYSDLQVLKSAAGWFIGTIYTDETGFPEAGSRDSDYFATEEEAKQALEALEIAGDEAAAMVLRDSP